MTRSNSYPMRRQRAGFRPQLETLEDRTAPAVFTVTNTSDSGPGSLRQAVLSANAAVGADSIVFDAAVFATARTVQMTGGPITITDPLTIQGPAAGLTLDAGGLSGHFTLSMTRALDPVSMSNLTLSHGGGDSGAASLANKNASLTLSTMVITDSMNGGISVGSVREISFFNNTALGSIAKLLLTESTVSDNSAGGINIDYGEADVRRSIISSNSGGSGGGIRVGSYATRFNGLFFERSYVNGSLTLTDSTINENTSTTSGGGINVRVGQATVIHSTIAGNLAGLSGSPGGSGDGSGGGINVDNGSLTIARSTITGNAAISGAGINVNSSTLTMDECNVSRNLASTMGGGINLNHGQAAIRNSTISGNAVGGGALASGGGIALSYPARLSLQNSTVAFNSAGLGSGGGVDNRKGTIEVRNVILSNNVAQKAGPDLNGEANLDYSLISNTSGAFITGGNNLLDTDARLGPLADNGGPTRTHKPGPGSPVRNAGGETTGLTSDQRGPGFARVLQGRPDIGALESVDPFPIAVATVPAVIAAGGTVYVIVVSYSDDNAIQASSLGTGDLSVAYTSGNGSSFGATPTFVWADVSSNGTPRLATYVFTPPGGAWGPEDNGRYTVYVNENQVFDTDATPRSIPSGAIGTIAVHNGMSFLVDERWDVDDGNVSPGHVSLREAVNSANLDPDSSDTITFAPAVFDASRTIALGSELEITGPVSIVGPPAGLTLDGGGRGRLFDIDMVRRGDSVSITGLTLTNGSAGRGGGIQSSDATLRLSRMVVTNNRALADGGGIAVTGGSLTLADSTISGNSSAAHGGGIFAFDTGSVAITGSTVSGNSCAWNGGGVYSGFWAGTPNSGNSSAWSGGGMSGYASSWTMSHCTVSGNTAGICGGGIAAGLDVSNSTIAYNAATWGGGGIYGGGAIESTILANNTILANSYNVYATGPDLFGYGQTKITFSLIGNTSGATLDPTSANNLLDVDPRLGPLADNGGPTRTHGLLPDSPAINAGSNPANLTTDQRGPGFPRVFESAPDIGAFEAQQSTVRSVVVNAGQSNLVQRSMVTSLTVTFSGPVTFAGQPTSAFRLTRTGPGGPSNSVTLAVDLSGSTATRTIARLTFSGPLTEGANSLVDGNYTLTVLSSRVNGGLFGGDNESTLFRLYGDGNGDKAFNGLDLSAFRTAFGTASIDAGYVSYLDFNGDGVINGVDVAAFRSRFGIIIP